MSDLKEQFQQIIDKFCSLNVATRNVFADELYKLVEEEIKNQYGTGYTEGYNNAEMISRYGDK